jgi:phage shock protein A
LTISVIFSQINQLRFRSETVQLWQIPSPAFGTQSRTVECQKRGEIMGIFSRFRDIVTSNINAILDCAEDPEKMVRLMIQEMEDTLIEVKSSCAGFMAEQKRLERALKEAAGEAEAWQARARLAVEKNREDLARAALAEKQLFSQRADMLKEQAQHTRELVTNTQSDIAQLESKLNDAREKQRLIIQRRAAAMNRMSAQQKIRRADTTDAFTRFEAYENGIDRIEAEADLTNSLRPKPGLHEQFNELEHSDTIEAELEKLKGEIAGSAKATA